ncbi:MAG: hypothetical protein WD825_11505 [Gemmatimonadaceae bacterium]
MRKYPTVIAGLAAFLGAACSDDIPGGASALTPTAPATVAAARAGKLDVCHREGDGGYHLINVSVNAAGAHSSHGDGIPGAAVPGDPSKKFDSTCALVDAAVCPCRFTVQAIADLNAQFGDLGTDYDFLSTNVVTQVFSRSDVGERRLNRFLGFQAPGPDWPQAFMCVTRVFDLGFAVLHNEELPVTSQEAAACVDDLTALARVLGVPVP